VLLLIRATQHLRRGAGWVSQRLVVGLIVLQHVWVDAGLKALLALLWRHAGIRNLRRLEAEELLPNPVC